MLKIIKKDIIDSINDHDSFQCFRLTNTLLNREQKFHNLDTCKIASRITGLAIRFFLDIASLPCRAIYAGIIKPGIEAAQILRERIGYAPVNEEDDGSMSDNTLIDLVPTPPQVPTRHHLPKPASLPEPTPAPAPTPPPLPVTKPINEEGRKLNPSLARFLSPNTQSNGTRPTFDPNQTLNANLLRFLPENIEKEKL